MTAYTDFTRDFPGRCLEVLEAVSSGVAANGREITLLYMAASASLLVPFERLKAEHPFGDSQRKVRTADRLTELLGKKFVGSVLCPTNTHSWRLARKISSVDGELDGWLPNAKLQAFSKGGKVESTLTLIRNALAHGNIYTVDDPIRELVFVKEVLGTDRKRVGFDVVQVSHEDFLHFVRAWVGFLQAPDEDAGSQP